MPVEHAGDTASRCWRAALEYRGVPAILEIIRARDLALLDELERRWRHGGKHMTEVLRALREEMAK